MAGVAGRSGRRFDDSAYAAVRDQTVNLAWRLYRQAVDTPEGVKISDHLKYKLELAKVIISRTCPQQISVDNSEPFVIQLVTTTTVKDEHNQSQSEPIPE